MENINFDLLSIIVILLIIMKIVKDITVVLRKYEKISYTRPDFEILLEDRDGED